MRKLYFILFVIVASLFHPELSECQITITPGVAASIMANKLAGPGVVVINPVLTCATNAYGTFVGTSTLSFDSGIVLTNGQAQTTGLTVGANGPASGFASTSNGTPGNPLLTALAGVATNDACMLDFDFRPIGDTIKFDYVFGSEEYTSFTCSDFNDVFGFFITGPGYGAATNLARVPGTTIPVCINSVNCGATGGYTTSTCNALGAGSPFCAYYVNNSTGTTITYDGLTTTLTAIGHVTPCDTYHLKIGIADGFDDILDSGVFLKAGSLTSVSFSASSLGINPADTGYGSQYCIRGCSPGMFIFKNTGSLINPLTIHFNIGGTATNGTDYTTIADSVIIPAHDSVDTVFIWGLVGPTGTKTVTLYIIAPFTCGGATVIMDSVQLTIYDSLFVKILTPDTAICTGQSVYIHSIGGPGLSYLWGPAATLNNDTLLCPTATPTITTTYTVTATMGASGCPPSHQTITITVVYPPSLNVGPPIQHTCVGVPLNIGVVVTPPGGAYGYTWTPAGCLSNSTIANPVVTPTVAGDFEYIVHVTTPAFGCDATDSFLLHVLPNDFTLVSPDTGVCYPPGTYQIIAFGDTEFSYQWTPPTGVSNTTIIDPTISPTGNMIYTITASYPGCPDMVHTISYYIENPLVNIVPSDTTFCIGSPVPILVNTYPVDSPYTLAWTPSTNLTPPTSISPNFFTAIPGDYYYHLTIHSGLGCISTDSLHLHVLPNDFTLASPDSGMCFPVGACPIVAYGDSEFTYHWVPTVGVSNPNILEPSITPPGSMTYSIIATYPNCPDMVHSLTYTIQHPVVNIVPADTIFCIGSPIFIAAMAYPPDSPYTLTWSPTTNLSNPSLLEPYFYTTVPGIYKYNLTIQTSLGCTSTDSVVLRPSPLAHIQIIPGSATINYGDHVQLQTISLSTDPLLFYWVPDDGTLDNTNISDPVATPKDTVTTYMVYAMNQWGCRDSTSVTINLEYPVDCLPSAFTPNNDGLNDVFRLCSFMHYQKLLEFRIFNRWGQMVYENTSDPKAGWDGTFNGVPQDMGVYNYVIEIEKPDHTTKVFKGDVTLIR